ncbi:DNA primase [Mycoplasmopsis agassizii]|uniref:DNA primase n=1 Tax=Mycoplasmopsis agassizii TaxID=33922 RepID=A0ABX4H5F5_9BACT|nr:DNA primase [Mycoplasmopsis agassizii]PAF55131.1 DNA primase [Mycoplasmopsis agassizii]SMC16680.1 DNA primase [Mycoplasmopsis agassizii]
MNYKELENKIYETTSLSDYISKDLNLTHKGNSYIGLCPFHDDKNASFSIKASDNIFTCWSCGKKGGIFNYVMLKHEVSFPEAVRMLAQEFNIDIGNAYSNTEEIKKVLTKEQESALLANNIAASYFYKQMHNNILKNDALKSFLEKRKIDKDLVTEFSLGYADGNLNKYVLSKTKNLEYFLITGLIKENFKNTYLDSYRERLVIPIHDEINNLVGFGARTIIDENPKYINSSDNLIFSKSQVLFNFFRAKNFIKTEKSVIFVEGYLDVLSLWKIGVKNVVAIMGTNLTSEHIKLIKDEEIILFLDNDLAGVNATINVIKTLLSNSKKVSIIFYFRKNKLQNPNVKYDSIFTVEDDNLRYDKIDADTLVNTENGALLIKNLIEKRISGIDFIYKHLRRKYHFNNSNNILNFQKEFSEFLGLAPRETIQFYKTFLQTNHSISIDINNNSYRRNNVQNNNNYETKNAYLPTENQPIISNKILIQERRVDNSLFSRIIWLLISNTKLLQIFKEYLEIKKRKDINFDYFEFVPRQLNLLVRFIYQIIEKGYHAAGSQAIINLLEKHAKNAFELYKQIGYLNFNQDSNRKNSWKNEEEFFDYLDNIYKSEANIEIEITKKKIQLKAEEYKIKQDEEHPQDIFKELRKRVQYLHEKMSKL